MAFDTTEPACDLAILVAGLSETSRLDVLLPALSAMTAELGVGAEVIAVAECARADFAALPEILVRLYAEGYRVAEMPFQFAPDGSKRAQVRFVGFAWSYLKTLWRLWRLRNSIQSADYDHRAFDSIIPLQRYWQ